MNDVYKERDSITLQKCEDMIIIQQLLRDIFPDAKVEISPAIKKFIDARKGVIATNLEPKK